MKINQSALDPLGIPLTTTIVSGEKADDPLYIPEISKVQKIINTPGVLFIGDCKMASLETRAYVASSGDYYLCPLSAVQMTPSALAELLLPVWRDEQALSDVYRPKQEPDDVLEKIAEGFTYTATLQIEKDGEIVDWNEQRLVVHSLKHAAKQEKKLVAEVRGAQQAIAKLNKRGRGIKRLNQKELDASVNTILKKYTVCGLLKIEYSEQITQTPRSANNDHESTILIQRTPTVHAELDKDACLPEE